VAVDHYAIKAWQVIVRKDEQFIPELSRSLESGRLQAAASQALALRSFAHLPDNF